MWKAFQGANGWYVAWEREDGFHRQPGGGSMDRAEAEEYAAKKNAEEQDVVDDMAAD